MATTIFYIVTAVVLFLAVQAVKKFAPTFFAKVSKFVPLSVGVLAVIAQGVFNIVTTKSVDLTFFQRLDFTKALQYGALIASAEVAGYEGIYKLIKSLIPIAKEIEKSPEATEEKEENRLVDN